MIDKMFYLRDSRGNTGSNVMFWRLNGAGYCTNIDDAEKYSLEEAQRQHNSRNSDVPLLASEVESRSIFAVDCQNLKSDLSFSEDDECVVQLKGRWNGNDIYFMGGFSITCNYQSADILSYREAFALYGDSESHEIRLKKSMDSVARRTFQSGNIDLKIMAKKAGIKIVKPKRKRATTGKTRGNCPTCGKITWDFNPYENAPCKDHEREMV